MLGRRESFPPAGSGESRLARAWRFPRRLSSAGQKRRVALARLLSPRDPLWILDEPATGSTRLAGAVAQAMPSIARGGMICAATHARGLVDAKELRPTAGSISRSRRADVFNAQQLWTVRNMQLLYVDI